MKFKGLMFMLLTFYIRVHKFDLETVSESRHGEFFMGDCYVILYAYNAGNKENYIVYHWQVWLCLA